jgi:DNA-binding response OmpR family regulator
MKSSLRILVADDEPGILRAMSLLLRAEGYQVVACADGKLAAEALHEARRLGERYDLLITDIHMPSMDGIALLQHLRNLGLPTRTLGISGQGDKGTVLELMRLGCQDFLDKPFNDRQFLETVEAVLRRPGPTGDPAAETQLRAEIGRYRRDIVTMQERIHAAQGEFQNLMATEQQLPIPLELKIQPLQEMGGDLFLSHVEGNVCDLLVGDVAGHDQGASYMALLVKTFFEEACRSARKGSEILLAINQNLVRQKSQRMVTAMHLRLDLLTRKVEVHNAGHVPMIRIPADPRRPPEAIHCPSVVLGIFEDPDLARERFFAEPGERFALCSDGLYSLQRMRGATAEVQEYGVMGLLSAIARHRDLPLDRLADALWSDALVFSRHKAQDDLLLGLFEFP